MPDLNPAAAILTAVFSPVPTTPATATPAPTAPTAPPAPVEPHSHSGLSPSEAVTMAKWAREDVASGEITPEAAAKIFDNLGTPPNQRDTPADTHSDEQRLIDEQFPAAKPEDYKILYADHGQPAPPISTEMKQFDAKARG